jgi:plasmid stabilization system protein ParE
MGHSGRARDTYEWVVGGLPYIIVYEVDKARDAIAILAVFHGAQDRDQG